MPKIEITQEIADRRKTIHQYIISEARQLTCKEIGIALGLKSSHVSSDLILLVSLNMVVADGLKRVVYDYKKGSTVVGCYIAGPVTDESGYSKNYDYRKARDLKKNELVYERGTDEPPGRWKVRQVAKGHTVYRVGREYKYGSGQTISHIKKGKCSTEYV